jgi:hypothetical protein
MLGRPNVGDIRDPFGVGGYRGEVPLQMIPGPTGTGPRGLLPPLPPLRYALQPRSAHQARHPVTATPLPSVAQVFPDARTAHNPIMVGMEVPNLCE